MRRHRFGSRRGSTMLESALVLGSFLFLIIGTLDIGRVMFMHQTLTERARDAVRWGAANAYNASSIQNVVLYGSAAPADTSYPLFGLDTSNVQVSRALGASETPDRVTVRITNWSYQMLSPYIAGRFLAPDIVTSMTMENP